MPTGLEYTNWKGNSPAFFFIIIIIFLYFVSPVNLHYCFPGALLNAFLVVFHFCEIIKNNKIFESTGDEKT